jgi:hypothetical protein
MDSMRFGNMRAQRKRALSLFTLGVFCLLNQSAYALTLAELLGEKDLTPARLMAYVSDFTFAPGRKVRSADAFLAQRSGDCDDFATLADEVLSRRGYTTRLVAVFMPSEVHVVCYVAEVGGYLDFNRRKEASPLVRCANSLGAIGGSVARSFKSDWLSVSEYRLVQGEPDFLLTEFR